MGPVELLHMSVFSQSFSPCGRFLAAGNNYGEIAVFSLSAALSPDATALSQKPVLTFTGNGEISCWSWSDLTKKNVKPLWTKRPNFKSSLEIPEINAMVLNTRDNSLVVGGGDNNIHILDLEHGIFKAVLQGHSDYVHCLSDGAVRMWDSRTGQSVHCVEIYKYESCTGCCVRQTSFYQDMILAVGEGPSVAHCLLGGEVKAQIPCTPQSLNTLQLNTNSAEHRMLTVGGSSNHIDVFTNLSYRAFSL
ncbi:hypothetical protein KUCAC02_007421, partial [Chaenocephalus aceratus]